MNSRIESIIDEMEEYIEDCKVKPLSNGTIILADKEQLLELITELRIQTPEEVKKYEKIIKNKEAILADAKRKAEEIVNTAQVKTTELISEHQIMQQAYAQADEVIYAATQQAQQAVDDAIREANEIRLGAITYIDDMLKGMEEDLSCSIETSRARTENLCNSLQEYLNVIQQNRSELVPQEMNIEEVKENTKKEESSVSAEILEVPEQ